MKKSSIYSKVSELYKGQLVGCEPINQRARVNMTSLMQNDIRVLIFHHHPISLNLIPTATK